mmetsp:Transcript_54631/g.132667  ORF Transcript_54631/g.132667 Transcript_54631/m.132667 type:complete len:463 (+) Transcript_54631:129-1517(+)
MTRTRARTRTRRSTTPVATMMNPWRQIQLLVAVSACYSIATTGTGTSTGSTMVDAFSLSPAPTSASSSPSSTLSMTFLSSMDDLTFETPDVVSAGIEEQACIDAASKMKRMAVPVPADVSPNGSVGISYIHWPAESSPLKKKMPPLILLHGFDSSGLEYRRLGPKLAAAGVDTYAVDVLGWGYTQIDEPGQSFSAQSKITALQSFAETLLKNNRSSDKFCVAGASLGGAAAIELAYASKESCAGLVLIDAQGFVDGVGPMALLPTPLAKAGVAFLKSVPLRNSANQMSYYDVDTYATEEAQMIGRLHCLRPGWSDAMVNFMQSGGFKPSSKVSQITSPSLVLWGREDGILDGAEFANKFVETLPDADLTWIEECGHVPHLEQPDRTCSAIVDFLSSKKVTLAVDGTYMTPLVGAAVAGGGADATSSTSEEQEEGDEAGPSPYVVGGGFLGALFLEEVIKTLF